eukprot:gene8119-10996_t
MQLRLYLSIPIFQYFILLCKIESYYISRNLFTLYNSNQLFSIANNAEDTFEQIGYQNNPDFRSGFVSIIGNPNVGKSTLMNSILGEPLCIVSPKPQTTRHRIMGVLSANDYQIVFSDTPGMLEPAYKLQETMKDNIKGAVGDADVILIVSDVYGAPLVDQSMNEKLIKSGRPILVVINKIDMLPNSTDIYNRTFSIQTPLDIDTKTSTLPKKRLFRRLNARDTIVNDKPITESDSLLENNNRTYDHSKPMAIDDLYELWNKRVPTAEIIPICARNAINVPKLIQSILFHMKQGPKYFPSDMLTNRDERFFTTEIIRETLLDIFRDEIPYCSEVVIETFSDETPKFSKIEATVIVERESQKIIVIGKGGAKLKELGTKSRLKLENFLGRRVYLGLQVKVDENWRTNEESLLKYGYVENDN